MFIIRNSISYKYVFPGSSDSLHYGTFGTAVNPWDEMSMGNFPSDRRATGSSGPFTFSPGNVIELQYAFVFGRDYVNTGAQAGLANMIKRSDSIQSYFDQGILTPYKPPLSVKNNALFLNHLLDHIYFLIRYFYKIQPASQTFHINGGLHLTARKHLAHFSGGVKYRDL